MSKKSDDKKRYAEYLCSREWNILKEAVKKRSGGTCERCKINAGDAVHHLTYERKYAERLEDLQHICNACHEYTHGKSDVDPAAERRNYLIGSIHQWMNGLDEDSLEHLYGFMIGDAVLLHATSGEPLHPGGNRRLRLTPAFAIGFCQATRLNSDAIESCQLDDGSGVDLQKVNDVLRDTMYWKSAIAPDEA